MSAAHGSSWLRGPRIRISPKAPGPKGLFRLGAAAVLVGMSMFAVASAAQASQLAHSGSGWAVQPTPNQNTDSAAINELSGVSCYSPKACTAVGSHAASQSANSFTLAERWNGTKWQIETTVLPTGAAASSFGGVSCASATSCVAVGSAIEKTGGRSVNLVEVWNGSSWHLQPVPTPTGSTGANLRSVSCSATNACTAIGFSDQTGGSVMAVAERWNGNKWSSQLLPEADSTQLFGVWCSSASACTIVGLLSGNSGTKPLAETWKGDGTHWHIQSVPTPSGSSSGALDAVSCTSPRACTATGSNFGPGSPTLAERWNGTSWHVQATPDASQFGSSMQEVALNGVSCASATSCTATGAYAPGGYSAYFLEAWNGTSWHMVTAPHPAGFTAGALNGVSCVVGHCAAVGGWSGGSIYIADLALAS